jgi:amidase
MWRMFQRLTVVLPTAQVFRPTALRADCGRRWIPTTAGYVVVPASLIGRLSVPVGFSPTGLPCGMQIIGRSGDDAGVLAIGQAWHRATDWPGRRPPLVAGLASR